MDCPVRLQHLGDLSGFSQAIVQTPVYAELDWVSALIVLNMASSSCAFPGLRSFPHRSKWAGGAYLALSAMSADRLIRPRHRRHLRTMFCASRPLKRFVDGVHVDGNQHDHGNRCHHSDSNHDLRTLAEILLDGLNL